MDLESRSPVGSSMRMMAGELANDLAIALCKVYFTLFAANPLIIHLEDDQPVRKVQPFSVA